MVNDISTTGRFAWRKDKTQGVPSTGVNNPDKTTDIFAFVDTVQAGFDAAMAAAQAAAVGIRWLPAATGTVRVRATGNVAIATALENGDTLNGQVLSTGMHVFLPGQSAGATLTGTLPDGTTVTNSPENGLYTVPASGAATRATFADSAAELAHIGFVLQGGTVGAGERWLLPLPESGIILGTTGLSFAPEGIAISYALEVEEARGDYPALADRLDAGDAAAAEVDGLVKGSETPSIITAFAGKGGFLAGRVMSDGALSTTLFGVESNNYPGFVIKDRKGFVVARFSADGSQIIGLAENEGSEPQSIVPYFAKHFVGWAGEPTSIYLTRLFSTVADADKCRVTVLGETGYQGSGEVSVSLLSEKLGATADLITRPRDWDGGTRAIRPLTVATAPNPPGSSTSPVIATFGDSITQASAAALIKSNLESRGYTPTFVGTRTLAGVKTEGRSGWEIGDMTYAVTDKVTIVDDAGFPAYLAMSEDDKLDRTPFLRPSTGGDASEDIVNGYVLDFTRYSTLASLATPTIVCIGDGTNDVRDRTPDEIYSTTYAGDLLRYRRMHAAWPSAKILRWFPPVPRDPSRDVLWSSYISMYRGAMDAIIAYADPKVILVPLWCCTNSDGGWHTLAGTTDPTTGVTLTENDDPIHPTGGTRAEMFRVLSAYIAAAARNLI